MKNIIQQRVIALSREIEELHNEREAMLNRDREIETRLHQLVGAIHEMQQLIAHLDRQPSAEVVVVDPAAIAAAEAEHLQTGQRSSQTSSETDDQSTET